MRTVAVTLLSALPLLSTPVAAQSVAPQQVQSDLAAVKQPKATLITPKITPKSETSSANTTAAKTDKIMMVNKPPMIVNKLPPGPCKSASGKSC